MKTIKLPTYNITISYTNGDQTNPKIVSDMKNKNLPNDHRFNLACDGLESLILAQCISGIDIASASLTQSIKIAYDTIQNKHRSAINDNDDLISLAQEFDGQVLLSNPTDIATLHTINVARNLVQQSTENFTIIVPDNVESLWSGEGCGEWIPAIVYLPNKVLN